MDPNANLEMQRTIVGRLLDGKTRSTAELLGDAVALADLVRALDEWLSKGGFFPAAWVGLENDVEHHDAQENGS